MFNNNELVFHVKHSPPFTKALALMPERLLPVAALAGGRLIFRQKCPAIIDRHADSRLLNISGHSGPVDEG